jgi:hypothetical protein
LASYSPGNISSGIPEISSIWLVIVQGIFLVESLRSVVYSMWTISVAL